MHRENPAEKNDLHLQKKSSPSSLMLLLGKKSGSGAQAEAEERPISNSEKTKSEIFQSETQSKDNSPLQGGKTHGNKAALAHMARPPPRSSYFRKSLARRPVLLLTVLSGVDLDICASGGGNRSC
jgi:hypothetical protein